MRISFVEINLAELRDVWFPLIFSRKRDDILMLIINMNILEKVVFLRWLHLILYLEILEFIPELKKAC